MTNKGWIALDIDGTITLDRYSVPREVIDFLRSLHEQGWRIALATGRTFTFSQKALSQFDFPYTLLPQNGSAAIDMPEKKLIFKKYLSQAVIPVFEQAYKGIQGDFLIYSGFEHGDICYYHPDHFSEEDEPFLKELKSRETLRPFSHKLETFPLVKCFGFKERVEKLASRLRETDLFQVALIRDPFIEDGHLLLVTDWSASKGLSLSELFKIKGRGERVIAAGDDENDLSLLEIADVKIAMAHAPEVLQAKADFIAKPTHELGIIHALQIALEK